VENVLARELYTSRCSEVISVTNCAERIYILAHQDLFVLFGTIFVEAWRAICLFLEALAWMIASMFPSGTDILGFYDTLRRFAEKILYILFVFLRNERVTETASWS
jgi:hypothetical protein